MRAHGFHTEDRKIRIHRANLAAYGLQQTRFRLFPQRRRPNVDLHVRLVGLPERHVNVRRPTFRTHAFLHVGHNADDLRLDRRVAVASGPEAHTPAHRIAPWPKFFGRRLIDNRHAWPGSARILRRKYAAALQRNFERLKIPAAHHVVTALNFRRLVVPSRGSRRVARPLNILAE